MNDLGDNTLNDTPQIPAAALSGDRRIASVDVMRGLALLGILVINIQTFALPDMATKIPSIAGGMSGLNAVSWWVSYMLFYHKCMPIFSMLFGAGLVLMYQRACGTGFSFRRFWMRRSLWLIGIGLLHGYALWGGDILYTYAVCGLLIYLFRRKSIRTLIIIASIVYLAGLPALLAAGHYLGDLRSKSEGYAERIEAGQQLSDSESSQHEMWLELKKSLDPTPDQLEEVYTVHRGGYLGILKHRAPGLIMMQTTMFLFIVMWRIGGLMLYGMAMMKAGVFSARRSYRFYILLSIIGYVAGSALVLTGARMMIANGFDFVDIFSRSGMFNIFGGPLVSLGHIGVAMIMCKAGILGWLRSSLAAVGRMALSNYLSHTIICTTLFYGYGFGLFGRLERAQLWVVVIAIWMLQMIISPLWLRYFRFGPAEWAWRSLTYGRPQVFRISVDRK